MMEALGIQQHVTFETHHAVNTGLLFIEITLQLNTRTFKRKKISDHRAIVRTIYKSRTQQ